MRDKETILREDIFILKNKIKEYEDNIKKSKREAKMYKEAIISIKKRIRSIYYLLRKLRK